MRIVISRKKRDALTQERDALTQERDALTYNQTVIHGAFHLFSSMLQQDLTARNKSEAPLIDYLTKNFYKSSAQNMQDLIVSYLFRDKEDLFFCDIGATDGKTISNSFYLEKILKWKGIVVEPNEYWHESLSKNRICRIDHRVAWSKSKEIISFAATESPEYSTVAEYKSSDQHEAFRRNSQISKKETISLVDLFREFEAPRKIDFLSIDTEGSELRIIEGFEFELYDISLIVVEHNFTANKEAISTLLGKNGYTEILKNLSLWDSWFVQTEKFSLKDFKFKYI